MDLPLNALRAFETAARHLNFTRAAEELHLTQTAVSQHVRKLEDRLGVPLFRRVPRGLTLTDEGQALLPVLTEAFGRMGATLAAFDSAHGSRSGLAGRAREVLTVGVVGTYAVGWLLPRLRDFQAGHPHIDLRLQTNNNRVDLANEGLDCALRFGDGSWNGVDALPLLEAPLTPLCAPGLAERLRRPADLAGLPLLRSFRADEWAAWFRAAGQPPPVAAFVRGAVFDSSLTMAEAAAQGLGVALLPAVLFTRDLRSGRLVRPFDTEVDVGRYWFTRLKSRRSTPALRAFRDWLLAAH